ncbi:S8 family peptidase [Crocosphaera sp.]|uniref:S8 family peptidase n=1 Tax=Crocosphaera sp. TaxID=2729996 RepID=UPI003F207DF8|nr:S8/S53 family peptidase [Crocosphaera sp.]
MPIYIIRPKANLVSQSLSLVSRKFTLESRRQQTQEVESVYREDSSYQTLIQWAEDMKGKENIQILKSPEKLGVTGTIIIEMPEEDAKNTQQQLPEFSILKDQPIDLIKPDKVTTSFKSENDLKDDDLWHLKAIKYTLPPQVTGKDITIAVLDTGIDSFHPSLRAKVSKSVEFDILQGQVKELTNSLDTEGHGTHVAGLICGRRIGIAPDATLINGLMIPKGRGSLANFIIALEWAANNPEIQIVNVSAGLQGFFSDMEEVISDMLAVGVLPVCASGNEGRDRTRSPGNYRSVLSVGASNKQGRVTSFSSSGTLTVENTTYNIPHLVAPGEAVYSSVVQGGYEAWNGTSMATPIVSGVAALILERYPDLTVLDLREELLNRCELLNQPKERQGLGLIQVGDLS